MLENFFILDMNNISRFKRQNFDMHNWKNFKFFAQYAYIRIQEAKEKILLLFFFQEYIQVWKFIECTLDE